MLAFDHPAFPAIGVEQVERRLLDYFPLAGDGGAALRAGLAAFDAAFAAATGGARFAAAPARRRAARTCGAGPAATFPRGGASTRA